MLNLPRHLVAGLSCFILLLLVADNSRTGANSGMTFLTVLILLQEYAPEQLLSHPDHKTNP